MKRAALKASIITAMMMIMMTATTAVTVFAADTEIRSFDISAESISIEEGVSKGLKVSISYVGEAPSEEIAWTSSDDKVASVSGGIVTAKKEGTAYITAELGGHSDTCEVIVEAAKASWVDTKDCYTLLNQDRKAQHSSKIKALKRDKQLEKIAKKRAKEIALSGKFSHTRPNGKKGISLIKGNKAKGENLAKGQKNCEEVTDAWYASPGHRKNMLRKNFKKVGIAGYTYKGVTYWAEVFSS